MIFSSGCFIRLQYQNIFITNCPYLILHQNAVMCCLASLKSVLFFLFNPLPGVDKYIPVNTCQLDENSNLHAWADIKTVMTESMPLSSNPGTRSVMCFEIFRPSSCMTDSALDNAVRVLIPKQYFTILSYKHHLG